MKVVWNPVVTVREKAYLEYGNNPVNQQVKRYILKMINTICLTDEKGE